MEKSTRGRFNRYSVIIVILMFIASLRIFMLDKDIPSWDISKLQPIDEYFYGTLAFNLYDYGKINIDDPIVTDQAKSIPQTKGTIIHNSLIYVSLLVFGNNYYGLRMPSVISALISILILVIVLTRIRKANSEENEQSSGNSRQFIIFALGYLVLDFTFLITSRICEPVIFRIAFIMLTLYMLYVFNKKNQLKLNYFIFGFLSTLSFLLVYTVNFFAFAAAIASVGVYVILCRDRKSLTAALFFILGIVSAVLITNLYYMFVWNGSLLSTIKSVFGVYGDRVGGEAPSGLKAKILMLYGRRDMILNSNMFLYSPVLLFSLLATLPLSFYKAIKTKKITDIFIVSLIVMMYFQTIFLDDYTSRKATTILPFILLNIFNGIIYKDNFMAALRSKVKFSNLLGIIYIAICGYFTFKEPVNTLRYSTVFEGSFNNILVVINVVMLIIVMLIFIMSLFTKLNSKILCLVFVITMVPNIILSTKYVYLYDSYTEKNIMVDVGKIVGNNYVMGGFPHGYRLYNSIKPVMSNYDEFRGETEYQKLINSYIGDSKVQYFIGYSTDLDKLREMYLKNYPEYRFEEIKRYERNYIDGHKKTYISLYRIVRN